MSDVLQAALRYAELGYPVFPCAGSLNPAPLTPHGFKDATTDADQIEAWWEQFPAACIGLATAGLLVVDIDGPGNPWLAGDYDKAISLAAAPTSLTPGGGRHHIFRRPSGKAWTCTVGQLAERVDTRTDGGYIVVPPSVRPDGAYRWVEGCELDVPAERLPEPPPWLEAALDELAGGRRRLRTAEVSPTSERVAPGGAESNRIPSGQRNATLTRLAGTMRRVGMSRAEIAAALKLGETCPAAGELALAVFEFSQNAAETWRGSNIERRREILDLICLNRTLSDVTLVTTKRKPFDALAERLPCQTSRLGRIPAATFYGQIEDWRYEVKMLLVLAA